MLEVRTYFIEIMRRCMEVNEIERRIKLLQQLNRVLPPKYKIQIPSFVTNNWIDKRLYMLEEKIAN
jgi:hypothetical protein